MKTSHTFAITGMPMFEEDCTGTVEFVVENPPACESHIDLMTFHFLNKNQTSTFDTFHLPKGLYRYMMVNVYLGYLKILTIPQ